MPAVSGCHEVGHGNINILQHLQSDCRSGASTKLFLNRPIQFLPRDAMLARYMLSSCVRPSVC